MSLDAPDFDALVDHRSGRGLPPSNSPRPYLHPVRSLAGTTLTAAGPEDHPHHAGLSIAFSDVNGTNFWGGSTYTSTHGPAMLSNHGWQEPSGWSRTAGGADGSVTWFSGQGMELATEYRSIRCFRHPAPGTWSLSIRSALLPAGGVAQLEVSSSAVKGRVGAGYGGIFWRFPEDCAGPRVFSASGEGVAAAHGSRSPWLAISTTSGGSPASVVLAQENNRPWFVRTDGYLGAGPAVAWSEKAVVNAANPLVQALHAVIHDGHLSAPSQALELLQHHPDLQTSRPDRTP